jgi:hypothetical protein
MRSARTAGSVAPLKWLAARATSGADRRAAGRGTGSFAPAL